MEITERLRSSLRTDEDVENNCIVLEPNCYQDYLELLVLIEEGDGRQTILGIIEIQLGEPHEVRFVRTRLAGTRDGTKLVSETEEQIIHECDSVGEIADQVTNLVNRHGSLPNVVPLMDFVSILSYCGAIVVATRPSVFSGGLLLEVSVNQGWANSFDLLASQIDYLEFEEAEYPFDLLATPDLVEDAGAVSLYSQVETPYIQPVLPWEGVDTFVDEFQEPSHDSTEEPNFPSLRDILAEKQTLGNTVSRGICEDAIGSLGKKSFIALGSNPEPNQRRTGVSSDNWLLISMHSDSVLVQYLPSQDGFFFELEDEYRYNDAFDLATTAIEAGFEVHQGHEALKRLRNEVSAREVSMIDGLLMEQCSGGQHE